MALGVTVALVSFALLYGAAGGTGPAIPVVIAALLTGAVGAKAWFVFLHRRQPSEDGWFIGWCIQGFVAGVLLAVGIAALLGAIPAGVFLDAAAPGVLLGIAAGRIGCFLAGCCVGRPTQSRWGVWSSDRRLGMRRIPTQLIEAALAAGLGVAALVFVVRIGTAHGGVFAASLAAYTLLRQRILGLRVEPRRASPPSAHHSPRLPRSESSQPTSWSTPSACCTCPPAPDRRPAVGPGLSRVSMAARCCQAS